MSDLLMEQHCNNLSDFDLKERDINLLQIIDEEDLSNFTFEGLKRMLKIHPEKLSRILSRLTSQEILKKSDNGYTLTTIGKKLFKSLPSETNNANVPLLQTFLPPISINKIVNTLQNKWFGQLRWLGHSATKNGIILKWITVDGRNILSAIFNQDKLQIEGKLISNNDLNAAINASHQLMGHITKLLTSTEHN
jgi:hypothetical protein